MQLLTLIMMVLRFICFILFFYACVDRDDLLRLLQPFSYIVKFITYAYSIIRGHKIFSMISQPQWFIFGICALFTLLYSTLLYHRSCVWLHANARVSFRDISISFQSEIFIKSKRLAIITGTLLYPVVCIAPFASFIKHKHLLSCTICYIVTYSLNTLLA